MRRSGAWRARSLTPIVRGSCLRPTIWRPWAGTELLFAPKDPNELEERESLADLFREDVAQLEQVAGRKFAWLD